MNWFKRLVSSWARQGNYLEEEAAMEAEPGWGPTPSGKRRPRAHSTLGSNQAVRIADSNELESEATLTFIVFNAIGGKVVEFRRYDRKTDRSDNTVYVIAKDEDFGEKIARIATLETLKG
jgi:hypothetical protein